MTKRLRVCNVDEEGRFGGPERTIVLVAEALCEMEVETHVVYPMLDSQTFYRHLSEAHICCTSLNITRLSKQRSVLLRYIMRFPAEVLLLAAFFRRHRFDLVQVNGSYQFKVALAAKLAGVPVVWLLNDTMMDAIVRRAFALIARRCANGFIVVGKKVYDYYLKDTTLSRKPCMEIHAPVNTEVFHPSWEGDSNDGTCTIATVSGINPTKGIEYFVNMAAQIHAKFPFARFAVAGAKLESHAQYALRIERMVQDLGLDGGILTFHGLVTDVPSFLKKADICVFTSISEASPTSVWEALSMGKPVVTTEVGSVGEFIEEGVSGYIVPVRDVSLLCDRVARLIEEPKLRGQLGAAARNVATKKLSVGEAARRHREIYDRIVTLAQTGKY